jgi:RNA polymerase sigma-70 factor (ECF subfamily)
MGNLNSLLTKYQDDLLRECKRYYRQLADAKDLLQEASLKMTNNIGRYDTNKAFMPWARRVIRNVYIDQLRAKKNELEEQAYISQIQNFHQPDNKLLRNAAFVLENLNELDSYLIQEVFMNNTSQRELAKELGLSQQAVSKRVHLAKIRFKELYDDYTSNAN